MADDTKAADAAEKAEAKSDLAEEKAKEAVDAAAEAEVKTEQAEKKTEEVVEAAEEKASEEPKKETKPVSKSLEEIIGKVEKLSVLELADLVHALEDRFGVSAQAPVAVAGAAAGEAAGEPAEEKTTFNVILSAAGANKISVIKSVRELVPTLGLKEAKDLVEGAPKPVLESVNKQAAEEAKTKLTAAGGTVELQ